MAGDKGSITLEEIRNETVDLVYIHTPFSTSFFFSQFFSLINGCVEGSMKEYQRKTVSFLCLLWWVACAIMNETMMFGFGWLQSLMLSYQKKV